MLLTTPISVDTDSFGLQAQTNVASMFYLQGWLEGLYRTLGKIIELHVYFLFKQPIKKSLCTQLHQVVVKPKVSY
jgi:hypothetical protein